MELLKKTSFCFFIIAIIYCIVLLIHISIKHLFNDSAEMISAFGSLLSAFGSFFAALIAVYVFKGWRHTEDHKTKNNHINNAINSFFGLQATLKAGLDQTIEISKICSSENFQRNDILIIVTKLQTEIVFFIREFTLHVQFFATVGNEQFLGSQFSNIIDELASTINTNFDNLTDTIKDKTTDEIIESFSTYSKFINGPLVYDIHKKILLEMTKKSKAITKESYIY